MTTKSARTTDSVDGLLGQVANEFFERLAAGEQPNIEEYAKRHPEIADLIREIFPALDFVRDSAAHHAAPQPKEDEIDLARSKELGDFRILRELGRGGMGVVYEAEQLSMGRRVALKVLPFAAMIDHKALQRFQNEVRAAATLDHDHITAVYSVGEERGVHYYAMQLVRGQSLATVINELAGSDRQTPLPGSALDDVVINLGEGSPADPHEPTVAFHMAEASTEGRRAVRSGASPAYFQAIARLGVQAAEALQHAHENGIVHRDIKPGNLLLDTSGKLWLTDFGLARLEADAGVTMTGDIIGTLRYMSPEQALAKRVIVDHRADIYSLGATLYELLTLQPVFDAQDRAELLRQIAFEEPRPLRQIDPGIPRELETIVSCALSKNPDERYDSAEALATDLQAFLENRSIQARRPTLLQRVTKWSQRHKPLVAAAVLILILTTIGLAVSTYLIADQQQQTEIALEQMREQRDEADRQRREATQQRNEAERQRAVADENFERAEKARLEAERNLQFAIETVDQMYNRLGRVWIADDVAATELQAEFLSRALQFYRRLVDNSEEYRLSAGRTADLYGQIADIETELQNPTDALEAREQALAQRRELCREEPDVLDNRMSLVSDVLLLGEEYASLSRHNEALKCYKEAAQLSAKIQTSNETARVALRFWQALLKQHEAELLLGLNRDLERARELASQAQLEYQELNREIEHFLIQMGNYSNYARTFVIVSEIARRGGELQEAEHIAAEALEKCEIDLLGNSDRKDVRKAQELLNSQLATIAVTRGNLPEAERCMRRQLEILALRSAAQRDPYTLTSDMIFAPDPEHDQAEQPDLWHTWATINLRLARVLREQGEYREAEIILGKTRAIMIYLSVRFRQKLQFYITAANTQAELNLLLKDRWPQEARPHLLEAANTWHRTLQAFPEAKQYRSGLHDPLPDFTWFQTTFPEYDFTNPNLTERILKPEDRGRSTIHDRVFGMDHYRHENYEAVAEIFQKIVDLRNGSDAFDQLHLTIGLVRTGKVSSAREHLASAIEWIEKNNAHDVRELQQLRAEAEDLLASIPKQATRAESSYPPPPPLPKAD